jgi:hypothetical protein
MDVNSGMLATGFFVGIIFMGTLVVILTTIYLGKNRLANNEARNASSDLPDKNTSGVPSDKTNSANVPEVGSKTFNKEKKGLNWNFESLAGYFKSKKMGKTQQIETSGKNKNTAKIKGESVSPQHDLIKGLAVVSGPSPKRDIDTTVKTAKITGGEVTIPVDAKPANPDISKNEKSGTIPTDQINISKPQSKLSSENGPDNDGKASKGENLTVAKSPVIEKTQDQSQGVPQITLPTNTDLLSKDENSNIEKLTKETETMASKSKETIEVNSKQTRENSKVNQPVSTDLKDATEKLSSVGKNDANDFSELFGKDSMEDSEANKLAEDLENVDINNLLAEGLSLVNLINLKK